MSAPKKHIISIPTLDIFTVRERRSISDERVEALMASIRDIGLQTPVTVQEDPTIPDPETGDIMGAYAIVAGAHRVEACRRLGFEYVPAFVMGGAELDAEMWEIDENLCRAELSAAERAEHLARRKELWEKQELQSAQVEPIESKREDGRGHRREGFAAETAKATGQSKATINRSLALAEKIAPEAMRMVKGTKLDNNKYLGVLAKQPKGWQLEKVSHDLAEPEAKTLTAEKPGELTAEKPSGELRSDFSGDLQPVSNSKAHDALADLINATKRIDTLAEIKDMLTFEPTEVVAVADKLRLLARTIRKKGR